MSKNSFFNKHYGINDGLNLLLLNYIGHNTNLLSVKKFNLDFHEEKINFFFEDKKNLLGNSLRKDVKDNIVRKIKINSYQGFCFKNKFPVRGQRRRSNAKTASRSNFYI